MTLKQWFLTAFIVVGLGMIIGAGVFFSCSGRSYSASSKSWACLNEQAHALASLQKKEPNKVWSCRCENTSVTKCKCYCIGQEYELIVEEAQ